MNVIVLGIETSCDDTAAALVEDGTKVLASVVSSQDALHGPFGGVVPELASRRHLDALVPVMNEALKRAGLSLAEVDGLAVTAGPGLIGSLLVGTAFAKGLALATAKPIVPVDHLSAHIHALFLERDPPEFPFVALLVSGGHTDLHLVSSHTKTEIIGRTRDDAAGEAFDKVAKLLDLGYPGGPAIQRLAEKGSREAIPFPRALAKHDSFDFSFSGIKTAVANYLKGYSRDSELSREDVAASFQEAVVDVLTQKGVDAAVRSRVKGIAAVGGVAANLRFRELLEARAQARGLRFYFPSIELCTDNGAMVAAAGYHLLKDNPDGSVLDFDAYSRKKALKEPFPDPRPESSG